MLNAFDVNNHIADHLLQMKHQIDWDSPTCITYLRVSMGWWLLRLSAKMFVLLRLSVNFFQLRLIKKLKIDFFCFKELNINKPVFFVSLKQNKGLSIISG